MGLFKESEIKKMIGFVQAEQITFSRMVELLNQKIDKDKINKDQWISMMDVVRGIECYLNQNENLQNDIKFKMQEVRHMMLENVISFAKSNL